MTTWHMTLDGEFKAIVGIPRGVKTFAIIPIAITPIGWPQGNFGPVARRPAAESIHNDHGPSVGRFSRTSLARPPHRAPTAPR